MVETRLLIVDDDPGICETLSDIFEEKGYNVSIANTGQDAVDRAKQTAFNAALIDIRLPDMKGTALLRKFRKDYPDMVCVIVTGHASIENAIAALEDGATGYFTKPLVIEEVILRTEDALDKQRLQWELKDSKEKLHLFIDSATDGFAIYDSELNLVQVNKAALRIFPAGTKKDHVIGKHILNITPGLDETGRYDQYLKVMETGEPFFADDIVPHSKFGDRHLAVRAFKVGDGLGLIMTDVTDRVLAEELLRQEIVERKRAKKELQRLFDELKKSQAQLIQSEKMSTVGMMTAGIAHELNNPLTAMLHFVQYCLKHTSGDDKRYTLLQDIKHETMRCVDIVNKFLTFSRTGDGKGQRYEMEDFAIIVARVLKLLSYRIEKQGVSVTSNVDEATPKTRMKANAMQEVLLNLFTNALDALEKGKKKELNIDVHPEGDIARLSVTDSGGGISPKNLPKIFDPFFTTKPVGKGIGLGLTLCEGIIRAHGGEIGCESEPGKGTVFHVSIPIKIKKRVNKDEASLSDRR